MNKSRVSQPRPPKAGRGRAERSDGPGEGRREWLQVGCSAFAGISLPAALVAGDSDMPSSARAKSVVLIYLTGGASHHDTFDMNRWACL